MSSIHPLPIKINWRSRLSWGQTCPEGDIAEVKWYSKVEDDVGWIYKMGVNWESLTESERKTLKSFLRMKD
jgi:hypothetical protein